MLQKPDNGFENAVLITHQECMDGAGCALMFKWAGGNSDENIRYIPAGSVERFFEEDSLIDSNKFLIIADLGFSSVDLADKFEKRGNIVLLDHHRTSLGLSERSWCNIDMDACGTELIRRYLCLEKDWQKHFASLVDDRDRWLNKMLPDSAELVDLMNILGQQGMVSKFEDYESRYNSPMLHGQFTDREHYVIECVRNKLLRNLDDLVKKVIVIDQDWGRTAYIISSESNVSEILNKILETRKDVSVAAALNFDKMSVSLRSRQNGVDVSQVAKLFGGGGHAAAAGHSIKKDFVKSILEDIH